jgi:tetratricopeptide (TPR) repeat protein
MNEDVCPLRAIDEISTIVRTQAAQRGVPLIDFEARLRSDCETRFGHTILGKEYFLDHVHPRIEVHQKLALWIIEGLLERGIIGGKMPAVEEIAAVTQAIQSRIDWPAHGVALRNLAKVLHWSGKFSEAAPHAEKALQLLDNDPESLLVLADCLNQLGDRDQAVAYYDQLLTAHPFYVRAMIPFGELLISREKYDRAKRLLEAAVGLHDANDPKRARAKFLLGQAHLQLGEYSQAEALLQQLHDEYPDDPQTLFFLAQSKSDAGDSDQALELYRQVLTLDPQHAPTHQRIGFLLLKKQRPREAIKYFDAALQLDPANEQTRQSLEIANQLVE